MLCITVFSLICIATYLISVCEDKSLSIWLNRVIPLILFAGNNYRLKGATERRRVVRNGAGGTAGSDILSGCSAFFYVFCSRSVGTRSLCCEHLPPPPPSQSCLFYSHVHVTPLIVLNLILQFIRFRDENQFVALECVIWNLPAISTLN